MEGKKIALIAGGLILATIVGFIGYRAMPQGEVTAGDYRPGPDDALYREMAKKCQGDFAKLSPADQKIVLEKNANNSSYATSVMTRFWSAIQQGK
jgi:hypothetical protein